MTEYLRMAFRNVGRRRKRAILTMIGIFVGIAAVVALVSLGQGLQQAINDQFEKVGADKIIIQPANTGFISEQVPGEMAQHEIDLIDDIAGVKEVTGMIFQAAQARYNNVQRALNVMSIPDDPHEMDLALQFTTWEIDEGRMLTHKDKGKVMVGYNAAKRSLFLRDIPVGAKIDVNNTLFKVVGVLKKTGDPAMDGGIVMPEKDARFVLEEPEIYSMIVAQSAKGVDPDVVAERIKRKLRKDRGLDEGKENFDVQTAVELIESFNQILLIIQVVFIGIAAISLLVGGIGIMNTMYTAVLERTREIGVMKAIGARNNDVLKIFLFESGLLGAAGGIVGIIIGSLISKLIELATNAAYGPGTLTAVYPAYLIFGVLAFSFLIGAVSGVLPARRASKLSPVDALRYE